MSITFCSCCHIIYLIFQTLFDIFTFHPLCLSNRKLFQSNSQLDSYFWPIYQFLYYYSRYLTHYYTLILILTHHHIATNIQPYDKLVYSFLVNNLESF
jgi:hypothetical protein